MSFELRRGESLRKGIRRIACKQLDIAMEQMTGEHKRVRDEAVHTARKCFKKLRAVLRLVRPVIGESAYRAENACFRDAGQPLTKVRDARVMIGALDELTDHFKEYVEGRSFNDTRKALKANLRAVRKQVLDKEDACGAVAAAIQQAQKRINIWADVPNKWRAVGEGLEDVYRLASEGFRDGSADATVEKLHEWRKQAKYLRYQLQVMTPLWPERIKEVADEADRLTELLGDDHDLAIMRQMLVAKSEPLGNPSEAEMLLALIDRRRAELEEESMLLGRRFFQDPPKEFTRRLKGYWKAWRSQARRTAMK